MKNLKTKFVAGVFGLISLSSFANAAITVDNATGAISGTLDISPFYGAFALIIVAVAGFWAAKKGLSLFSR
ncbi:hypothetical protein YY92_05585 [Campylobacter fetus]|uniref:hypothetical protein n=1 Tax=Campylobacter fetus TaxID=196 RepID=UPI0011CA8790|nr:hypothetical protein [Campylobacter fetus]EAJ1232373.1 hypothetical protein [Campylobacter fetus]EAK0414198.1 hypothetical protein [Campylobacter fetus]TXF08761.1 hypothetical protein FPD25_04520 [Campylobacter fetus subsp. fetus]